MILTVLSLPHHLDLHVQRKKQLSKDNTAKLPVAHSWQLHAQTQQSTGTWVSEFVTNVGFISCFW